MKRFFIVLLVGVVLAGWSSLLNAQSSQQEKAKEQAVSPEDAKQIREEVKKLGEMFGVKPETKAEAKPEQKQQTTMATVTDKALDAVTRAVATISGAIQKVAPEIWRIMIKQQYAKAVGGLVLPWGLLIITLFYTGIFKRLWKKEDAKGDDADWRMGLTTVIPFIAGFIFAIWGFVALKNSVLYLINPEYYAIRDLLEMILRSSGR